MNSSEIMKELLIKREEASKQDNSDDLLQLVVTLEKICYTYAAELLLLFFINNNVTGNRIIYSSIS